MKYLYAEIVKNHFNTYAKKRDQWIQKNSYYHKQLGYLYKFLIPKNKRVLEIGCSTGNLINSLNPSYGVGIDISDESINIARKKFPKIVFYVQDAQNIILKESFDYVILSDLIGNLDDIQKEFEELHKVSDDHTRIIINYYNYLWEPLLIMVEKIGLKMPQPRQNWLSEKDIENLLQLANLEVIKKGTIILIPFNIPFLSNFINRFIAKLPIIKHLCLVQYFVIRKQPNLFSGKDYSISIIIPARNEEGNIENAVKRIPQIGAKQEIIFVEGHSKDNTRKEILKVIEKYKGKKEIILVNQKGGVGKADAVKKGFAKAKYEMLFIHDADLTVDPEDLPKFYHALRLRKGEYVQGTRLVYPMQKQAMRLLNILGNKFFSLAFTWLLGQSIKDTLCGTKAIYKKDYEELVKNRDYFGDFDPFGDFELTFGATKLNLKILEIPIRYKARTYGISNISRFLHGWLLLRMTFIAAKKLKFF